MSWSLLRFTASSSAWSVIVPSYGAAMSTSLDVTGSDSPAALQLRAMNIIYEMRWPRLSEQFLRIDKLDHEGTRYHHPDPDFDGGQHKCRFAPRVSRQRTSAEDEAVKAAVVTRFTRQS
jgi:hypothetical protein